MRKIGYARVSTDEQTIAPQVEALRRAGCTLIFDDPGVSGTERDREGLSLALGNLEPGDALVIWKLDRLGRSVSHLSDVLEDFRERGISLVSLTEGIDTASTTGKLVYFILSAIAEFERDLIAERTRAGMVAQKRQGRHVGRPRNLTRLQLLRARRELQQPGATPDQVAIGMGVSGRVLVKRIAEKL